MSEKAKTYLERLAEQPSEKEAKQLAIQSKRALTSLNADKNETEAAILEAEIALEDAKCAIPFHAVQVVDIIVRLENLTQGLEALNALEEELFPEQ